MAHKGTTFLPYVCNFQSFFYALFEKKILLSVIKILNNKEKEALFLCVRHQ